MSCTRRTYICIESVDGCGPLIYDMTPPCGRCVCNFQPRAGLHLHIRRQQGCIWSSKGGRKSRGPPNATFAFHLLLLLCSLVLLMHTFAFLTQIPPKARLVRTKTVCACVHATTRPHITCKRETPSLLPSPILPDPTTHPCCWLYFHVHPSHHTTQPPRSLHTRETSFLHPHQPLPQNPRPPLLALRPRLLLLVLLDELLLHVARHGLVRLVLHRELALALCAIA